MNWQERMEQAQREAMQKAAGDAERRRLKDIEYDRRKTARAEEFRREIVPIFERFRPRQLLEEIKRDVWKVGEVDKDYGFSYSQPYAWARVVTEDAKVSLALRSKYKGLMPTGHFVHRGQDFGGGEGFYQDGWVVGEKETYLEIDIKKEIKKPLKGEIGADDTQETITINLGCYDSWGTNDLSKQFGAVSVWDNEAQDKLEELLLKSCVLRTQNHKLPLEIQEEEGRKIRKEKGWWHF